MSDWNGVQNEEGMGCGLFKLLYKKMTYRKLSERGLETYKSVYLELLEDIHRAAVISSGGQSVQKSKFHAQLLMLFLVHLSYLLQYSQSLSSDLLR